MPDEDSQLNIFGSAVPLSQLPADSRCTCDEGCQAEADEHLPECPVEQRLIATFGF